MTLFRHLYTKFCTFRNLPYCIIPTPLTLSQGIASYRNIQCPSYCSIFYAGTSAVSRRCFFVVWRFFTIQALCMSRLATKLNMVISRFLDNFSSATGKFVFQRKTTYFLLQVYLPCILIVMVSWASFWIHEEAVPARAAICVTTILTIITMLGVVNVNMPKVSYVKAVDFYLFISFLMVFLSLLEYIVVLNFEMFCKRKREFKQIEFSRSNQVCLIILSSLSFSKCSQPRPLN